MEGESVFQLAIWIWVGSCQVPVSDNLEKMTDGDFKQ